MTAVTDHYQYKDFSGSVGSMGRSIEGEPNAIDLQSCVIDDGMLQKGWTQQVPAAVGPLDQDTQFLPAQTYVYAKHGVFTRGSLRQWHVYLGTRPC